ncbi:MAG: BstXI family restriction endonuclease [Candidatus Roizmanbacteria bacterium]|nr:BstXI family restriction endonuclease [Candidatus Roizmanbacteria bacterium]
MKLPKLPQLLDRKIYKTGQTRGADDDVIYQNRVGRNSTVLIPYAFWTKSFKLPPGENEFENGFIVLISPNEFFSKKITKEELTQHKLSLDINTLIFYETREQWDKYNPDKLGWQPAQKRLAPLGGNYVARVPATTAVNGGEKIIRGFNTTSSKGAGIRVFEYASSKTIMKCRSQLEALFWLCRDSQLIASTNGMTNDDTEKRKTAILKICMEQDILNYEKLLHTRVLNKNKNTICPLCLEELSGNGFFNRMQQAAGREVPDLTVTELNLFHIEELRIGLYNHCPYNVGWGHHHCNVVTKDSGINDTLNWMSRVLQRNIENGYLDSKKSGN